MYVLHLREEEVRSQSREVDESLFDTNTRLDAKTEQDRKPALSKCVFSMTQHDSILKNTL